MTISELKELAKQDLTIDRSDLVTASVETPMRLHKWIDLLKYNKKEYNKLEKELSMLTQEKLIYYRKDYDWIPDTANELKMLINGDKDICELKYKIKQVESRSLRGVKVV